MPASELTLEELAALAGTRHPVVPLEYAEPGRQPYYAWLLNALHALAESSAGALRVTRDAASATHVYIAPGRLEIAGVALDFAGASLDLAAFNNDTALLWLEDNAGQPQLGVAAQSVGFPVSPHLKLAEATLAAGAITSILDRRFEAVFRV